MTAEKLNQAMLVIDGNLDAQNIISEIMQDFRKGGIWLWFLDMITGARRERAFWKLWRIAMYLNKENDGNIERFYAIEYSDAFK